MDVSNEGTDKYGNCHKCLDELQSAPPKPTVSDSSLTKLFL